MSLEWRPNPGKQEEFLSLPDSIFEALYGGALGGGKTEALVMYPIARGFHLNSRFNGIIFRRTFPQLEKHVIPKAKEYYLPLGAKYNDTKHAFAFPSGATLHLGYLDTDDDVTQHDGAEYNYIAFDELENFNERMYTYLITRCRSSHKKSGLPTIMRSSAMPGGVGHNWVRERFIDPAPQGMKIIIKRIDGIEASRAIFIPAKMEDNARLLDSDPNYINRLRALSEVDFKARAEGDWYAFLGMVFSEFRAYRRLEEPENALHVIEPFAIPYWWPRIAAGDWGFRHSTWLGKAAISPDLRIFIYYEYCEKEKYISTWASDFKRDSQGEHLETFELDPSAWQRRGDEKTIAEQFMEISGIQAHQADNDRLGGKMLLHEMFRWKQKPPRYTPPEGFSLETANYIMRIWGMDKRREYESMFSPEKPETNIPRVQIFNTCPNLIKCIQSLSYDETDVEDVKKYDGDDPYDGLRYLLKAVDRYVTGLDRKAKEIEARGKIITQLDLDGNQTAFYRKMEKLEAKNRTRVGIRLFH